MRSFGLVCAVALACAAVAGCDNKMDPKECDKLRGEAFDLVNKGQQCNGDGDCRQSEWPGCERAITNATYDKVKPMSDAFKKGQCEEPTMTCRAAPEAYCKQGLCVHREK